VDENAKERLEFGLFVGDDLNVGQGGGGHGTVIVQQEKSRW
jgi:hypothetical protein